MADSPSKKPKLNLSQPPPMEPLAKPSPMSPTKTTLENVSVALFHQDEEKISLRNFLVDHLPGTPYKSPLKGNYPIQHELPPVVYNSYVGANDGLYFHSAGPHRSLHFNPRDTVVGVVTCGGLCPGLNDVVRSLTLFALEVYGVRKVLGFRFGYRGLCNEGISDMIELNRKVVQDIHRQGGSFLGSSRGHSVDQFVDEMIANLQKLKVNILFCLGGDGTQRGANRLYQEIKKRNLDISVLGIPKTIDNDLAFVERTFGFESASEAAVIALKAAEAEARSAMKCVGIVKLMGRYSGFVACQAAVSFGGAHIVLIPENEIALDIILELLGALLDQDDYAVVVVAEGFGQTGLCKASGEEDASGNKKLGDVGVILKTEVEKFLKKRYKESSVKYIDPSYIVRSCVANTNDASFCIQLATHGVHEAMYGSTGCLIGQWHTCFTVVPIALCVSKRKYVNLQGTLWRAVREQCVRLEKDFEEGTQQDVPTFA